MAKKAAATLEAPSSAASHIDNADEGIIPVRKVNVWFERQLNVLLQGPHGIGKTSVIVQECSKRKQNVAYFSASTLDPWIDLIGIPRPKDHETVDEHGVVQVGTYIDLVRPEMFQKDEIDVIIFDELNRSPKKVRNALMELVQFRSINGRKLKRLKMVIGIINPQDDKETYDVEPMDPAQLDRFHIQFNMPIAPWKPWFVSEFGKNGEIGVDFWWGIPDELRTHCSPRRLAYCLEMAAAGYKEMIVDMLDEKVHPMKLISQLDSVSILDQLEAVVKKGDTKEMTEWVNKPNNYDNAIEHIVGNERYKKVLLPLLAQERMQSLAKSNEEVMQHVCANFEQFPNFEKLLSDTGDAIVAEHEREQAAAAAK